jgi:hypothetical protein
MSKIYDKYTDYFLKKKHIQYLAPALGVVTNYGPNTLFTIQLDPNIFLA